MGCHELPQDQCFGMYCRIVNSIGIDMIVINYYVTGHVRYIIHGEASSVTCVELVQIVPYTTREIPWCWFRGTR